jgi:hypothetical protein
MPTSYAAGLIALFAVCYLVLAGLSYLRTRGLRVVHCPVTRTRAFVRLDALRGALLLNRPEEVKVAHCSLWPERRGCFQWCRDEIEDAGRKTSGKN